MLLISFGATQFFLTRIKAYSYGPVTIVGEGAFSRIIPQGILEIILFLGHGGQFVSKFESEQTAMNSSLHEELRALASNLLR